MEDPWEIGGCTAPGPGSGVAGVRNLYSCPNCQPTAAGGPALAREIMTAQRYVAGDFDLQGHKDLTAMLHNETFVMTHLMCTTIRSLYHYPKTFVLPHIITQSAEGK